MAGAEMKQPTEDERIKQAIKQAKFKNERLKLIKSRHEHYLAEMREEQDDEQTAEL
jgi:hypothetical protein